MTQKKEFVYSLLEKRYLYNFMSEGMISDYLACGYIKISNNTSRRDVHRQIKYYCDKLYKDGRIEKHSEGLSLLHYGDVTNAKRCITYTLKGPFKVGIHREQLV